jgi:thiol-disulfide isomerase/thioredoxin
MLRVVLIAVALFSIPHCVWAQSGEDVKDIAELKNACQSVGTPFVLVNVWAVNCSHCMDELTQLSKLSSEAFKDSKELGFLSLCIADDSMKDFRKRYAAVLEKKNIQYSRRIWSGEFPLLQKELQLDATPYTALFDRTGNLLEVLELPRSDVQAQTVLRQAVQSALKAVVAPGSK